MPAAIRGPTGIPLKKTTPTIEPNTIPIIIEGVAWRISNPLQLSLVARIPLRMAISPGREKQVRKAWELETFPDTKGTRTAITKKVSPISIPQSSNKGKKVSILTNWSRIRMPAATEII